MKRTSWLCLALVVAGWRVGLAADTIAREGWSFDRSLFREDAATVEKAKSAGRDLGLTGWAEYDFHAPAAGWYELWISGVPPAWSREVSLDGQTVLWFATSSEQGDADPARKGWFKEANLFLTEGSHRLRYRRLPHPGRLPTAWELKPAAKDDPAASLRVESARTNAVRVGDDVSLKVLGGGAAPTSYEIVARNQADGKLTLVGQLAFPATDQPVEQSLTIHFPAQGVYDVLAKVGDKLLRPADLKAGEFLVVDTKNPPPASTELKTTPLVDIDCTAIPPAGQFWETEGPSHVVEKPFGKYRESSGRGLLGRGWGSSGFSYRFQLPDTDHIYRIRVDYPDDDRRSMGFWVNDGSDTRPNATGVVNTGGVETGDRFPLTQRMLTHEAFFYPRGNVDCTVAVLNLVPGMKAAASRIRIDRVDSGLPAAPVGAQEGRTFGYYTEESGRWLRFFGGTSGNPNAEQLKTLERWGQWNRYIGANLIYPTINVYQGNHYPSRILDGYFSTAINQTRLAALMAEKYGSRFVPEFHLSGQEWFDRQVMGVWVEAPGGGGKQIVRTASKEAEDRLIRDKEGRFGYSLPFTYNVLHPQVQEMYLNIFGELADMLGDTESFAGISSRIMMSWVWQGWNVLPGLDFGYDDWTVGQFEKDIGITVPGAEAGDGKYAIRFRFLTGPERERWIAWRCQKVFAFHQRLLARLQQAKPSAKLFFTWFGPDPRKTYSEDPVEQMREAGMDWKMYQNQRDIVIVPMVGYGRRYSTPLVDAAQSEMLRDSTQEKIGRLDGRGMGFFSEYFELNGLLDWAKLGGKPYASFDAAVPSGVNERELYAISLANCDSNFLLNGGNGWIFGTPEVMQPFLREYRALPAVPFEPLPGMNDPVAVWQHREKDGTLWFYAVNRLPAAVKATLATRGGRIFAAADGREAVPGARGLEVDLEPFMMKAFRAEKAVTLDRGEATTPPEFVVRMKEQVEAGQALAEAITQRRLAPEASLDDRAAALQALGKAREALAQGAYWQAKEELQREAVVRLSYVAGRYIPDVAERSSPLGVPVLVEHAPVSLRTVLAGAPERMETVTDLSYDGDGFLWMGGCGVVGVWDPKGKLETRAVFQPYAYDPGDVRHPVLPPASPLNADVLCAAPGGKLVLQQGTTPPVVVDGATGQLIKLEPGRSLVTPSGNGKLLTVGADGIILIAVNAGSDRGVYAYALNGRFVGKVSDLTVSAAARDKAGTSYLTGPAGTSVISAQGRELAKIDVVEASKLGVSADGALLVVLDKSGQNVAAFRREANGTYAVAWKQPLPTSANGLALSSERAVAVAFRKPLDNALVREYPLTASGLGTGKTAVSGLAGTETAALNGPTQLKVWNKQLYYASGGKLMRVKPGTPDRVEVAFDPGLGRDQTPFESFAFAPNGDLYLASNYVGSSRGVNLYLCRQNGDTWSAPEYLNDKKPVAPVSTLLASDLSVDANGRVIIPLPDTKEAPNAVSLFRWSPGSQPERVAVLGPSVSGDYGLAETRDGGMLVANGKGMSVTKIKPDGIEAWRLQRQKACPPGYQDIRSPESIAEDSTGAIWVADPLRHQLLKLDARGTLLKAYGSFGQGQDKALLAFNRPSGVATLLDERGTEWLYVADAGNRRLLKMKLGDL